jgi:DNA-binding NtrC family response regulator
MKSLVNRGLFREDLYYRLNVMRISLPPLSRRKSDLPLLIDCILKRLCTARDIPVKELSAQAMDILLNYDYPGNIRELENILEHAVIVCRQQSIEIEHFPRSLIEESGGDADGMDPFAPSAAFAEERQQILDTLARYRWNKTRTAEALCMDRSTLWRKIKKLKIQS